MKNRGIAVLLAFLALAAWGPTARAEVKEITLAQQFGAIFLPMMVMEQQKLVEKHLAARGMSETSVAWVRLAGPSNIVDAFLAESIHFGAQGIPSLAVLWDRTKGGIGIKGAASITASDLWLNVRRLSIKSLADFNEKDRIAFPSAKTSTQAVLLQMACEAKFGPGQFARLDPIAVSMAHPDALVAVLSAKSEVTAHFATSPYHESEIKGGLKTIASAVDILGGPVTSISLTTSTTFRASNPKSYAAVLAALGEAQDWINADKKRAAQLFIELTREQRMSEDEVTAMLSGKDLEYSKIPRKVGKLIGFMHRVGTIKTKPESWKDLYFPEAHELRGD